MNSDIFKTAAISQCFKSTYKKRLGAVVVNKNKIVGAGYNKVNSTGIPRVDGKHAEMEALNNTTAKYRQDSIIYVCRINKMDQLVLAKPCDACQVVMRKLGVKYVWYSTETGWEKMVL